MNSHIPAGDTTEQSCLFIYLVVLFPFVANLTRRKTWI